MRDGGLSLVRYGLADGLLLAAGLLLLLERCSGLLQNSELGSPASLKISVF